MTEETKKTLATPDGCDLVVENVQGKISVEGWDRPETEVIAVRHQEWAEIEIYQEGRQVVARTKDRRGPPRLLNRSGKDRTPTVDYAVRVPHASNVRLKNVNGPVHVAHVQGNVHTNNVDGLSTLQAITGQVRSETVNGPIQATGLDGEAQLKAVNGRVVVQESRLCDLAAEAVNGQIEVATTVDVQGRYTFKTVNGSCHLTVPPDAQARVSVDGLNSGVDCSLPARAVERSFGSWRGVIGEGDGPKAEITFHTINGRLRLDSSEATTETPIPFVAKAETKAGPPPDVPEPLEPSTTPIEIKVAETPSTEEAGTKQALSKTEILQMTERGEISVDEALELLKG